MSNKRTAKVYACIPGAYRREFVVNVQEVFCGVLFAMATKDRRFALQYTMEPSVVEKAPKEWLKGVLHPQCARMAEHLRNVAKEDSDGRTEAVQVQDSAPEGG
jgi:hypothetical protein